MGGRPLLLAWLLCRAAGAAQESPLPYTVERFSLPGPLAGVAARIDVADPRVQVQVALADDRDPDGAGPCAGQLDTASHTARKHGFAVTLNAGYFSVPAIRTAGGVKLSYFVGNATAAGRPSRNSAA